jgi:hypothetical protein
MTDRFGATSYPRGNKESDQISEWRSNYLILGRRASTRSLDAPTTLLVVSRAAII